MKLWSTQLRKFEVTQQWSGRHCNPNLRVKSESTRFCALIMKKKLSKKRWLVSKDATKKKRQGKHTNLTWKNSYKSIHSTQLCFGHKEQSTISWLNKSTKKHLSLLKLTEELLSNGCWMIIWSWKPLILPHFQSMQPQSRIYNPIHTGILNKLQRC